MKLVADGAKFGLNRKDISKADKHLWHCTPHEESSENHKMSSRPHLSLVWPDPERLKRRNRACSLTTLFPTKKIGFAYSKSRVVIKSAASTKLFSSSTAYTTRNPLAG
jgi:hypothetical protein